MKRVRTIDEQIQDKEELAEKLQLTIDALKRQIKKLKEEQK